MSVKYYKNSALTDMSDMLIKTTGDEYYQEVDCTAAEYAMIDPHDPRTVYVVTLPDESIVKYLGDEEIGYDKYYTIERAAIVKEEDAESMIIEHEVINVDVVSGTTAVYGNASNKFIASGCRVVMAATNEHMSNLLTREDIYGKGVSFSSSEYYAGMTVSSLTITSISFVDNTIKRYSFYINISNGYKVRSATIDIPANNVLSSFGVAYKATGINQTSKICNGELGMAAIDNEGNKYFVSLMNSPCIFPVNMSDTELNFALGMTERYEVVET